MHSERYRYIEHETYRSKFDHFFRVNNLDILTILFFIVMFLVIRFELYPKCVKVVQKRKKKRLTKNRLKYSRCKQHCSSSKFIRQIAADNATGGHTNQKEHFRHILQILTLAHQIPFGCPCITQIIVHIVFPGGAFHQFRWVSYQRLLGSIRRRIQTT